MSIRAFMLWFVVLFLALSPLPHGDETNIFYPTDKEPLKSPVIIVGAGLTGLTVAYELNKVGIPSLILEARPWPGGRVQTAKFGSGVYVEAHMEEYWESGGAYKLLRELKLPLKEEVAYSSVRLDGKIYPSLSDSRAKYLEGIFTAEELSAYRTWSQKTWETWKRAKALLSQGKPLPEELSELSKISFAAYIARQKLPHRVGEWVRVTLEPEIATEWDQLAALDGLEEIEGFINPETAEEKLAHVEGGNSRFIAALVGTLKPGSVVTQATVTAIYQNEKGVYVRYFHQGSVYREAYGRVAVVTVPLWDLKRIQIYPSLPLSKLKAISTLSYGTYIKIHLGVSAEAAPLWHSEGQNVLPLLSDSFAGCIYEATAYQPQGKDPQADRVLTLLIYGRFAQYMLEMSANETQNHAVTSLNSVFPGIGKHVRFTEIFVYPKAVACWPVNLNRSRFDELSKAVRVPEKNLYFGGDTTENTHSQGAVAAGMRIAEALIARKAELVR